MKKLNQEYIELLKETIRSKDKIIDELLRNNRDMIQETRNLIYEFRKYVELKEKKEKKEEVKEHE